MKRKSKERERIFAGYSFDRGLISRIDKELKKKRKEKKRSLIEK